MSQECVKQGVCRKCGSPNVITSEPHNHSGIWCTRTATCVSCHTSEEYVYELVFVGYEKPGSDDILPAPSDRPTEAIERFIEFQLETTPEGCEEDVPFLSESVLYPLVGKTDARTILALWKNIERPEEE